MHDAAKVHCVPGFKKHTCSKICIIVFSFHSSPLRRATAERTSQALKTVPGIPVNTSRQPCSISAVKVSRIAFSRGMSSSLPSSSSSAALLAVLSSSFFSVLEVPRAAASGALAAAAVAAAVAAAAEDD